MPHLQSMQRESNCKTISSLQVHYTLPMGVVPPYHQWLFRLPAIPVVHLTVIPTSSEMIYLVWIEINISHLLFMSLLYWETHPKNKHYTNAGTRRIIKMGEGNMLHIFLLTKWYMGSSKHDHSIYFPHRCKHSHLSIWQKDIRRSLWCEQFLMIERTTKMLLPFAKRRCPLNMMEWI